MANKPVDPPRSIIIRNVPESVRRGLKARCPTKRVNGLLILDPPPGIPEVTTELVKRLEADEF